MGQLEEQARSKPTTQLVLLAAQKFLMKVAAQDEDYDNSEPFPVEITELFLYSPDGATVLLVFPFLGQDFVLSETEITVEHQGKVMSINDPLKTKILEYLLFRLKLLRELSL